MWERVFKIYLISWMKQKTSYLFIGKSMAKKFKLIHGRFNPANLLA